MIENIVEKADKRREEQLKMAEREAEYDDIRKSSTPGDKY